MLKLFVKDVKAGAIFLWGIVPLNAVTVVTVSRSGDAVFWANVTFAAFVLVWLSMLEWKNGSDLFVHSLPVTRAMVVRGRYLSAIAIGLLSMFVAAAIGIARGAGLEMRGGVWPRWVAADTALAFLLAYAIVAAIYLPCYFRWGFPRGNVAAALVLAAGIILSSAAGPAAMGIATSLPEATARHGVTAGIIPLGVARLVERLGLAGGGAAALGVAGVLLWVSSAVAVRACRRQEC